VGERKKRQIRTHHERCGHPKDPVTDRGWRSLCERALYFSPQQHQQSWIRISITVYSSRSGVVLISPTLWCNHHFARSTNHRVQPARKSRKRQSGDFPREKPTQIATVPYQGWIRKGWQTGGQWQRKSHDSALTCAESTMSSIGTKNVDPLAFSRERTRGMRERYAVARAQTVTGRSRC
jgi:hypothetical protein